MDNNAEKYTKEQFKAIMDEQIDVLFEGPDESIGLVKGCLMLAFVQDETCGIPDDEREGCGALMNGLGGFRLERSDEGFPAGGRMTQREFLSYVKQQSSFGLYDNETVDRQDPLLNLISLAHVTEMGECSTGRRESQRTTQQTRAIRSQLIEMLNSFPEDDAAEAGKA